jgi:phage tail sheath protein FI
MRDLVFEPQTTLLWDRIHLRLVSRCYELLRSGALAGTDPAQAFFVKCDGETNTPDEIDLGRVVSHVGLAPSVPAEFIVVRIEHDPSGVTSSSLSE